MVKFSINILDNLFHLVLPPHLIAEEPVNIAEDP